MTSPKRIAIVAPSLAGLLRDRSNLIGALKARGHTLVAVAASQLAGEVAALHHLGGEHRNFDPRPPGLAIFANIRTVQVLRDLLAAWKPDTVIVSGTELASLAAVAARRTGAKRIIAIVGGLGLGSGDARSNTAKRYARAVKLSQAIICHNADDARLLAGAVKGAAGKIVVTAGDGVDLEAFPALPLPETSQPVTFLMIADPAARDAIQSYTAAAQAVAAREDAARFEIASDRETADDPALFVAEGVAFHGRASDPKSLLARVHVAVQLSADDGSPTALKQALAAGRPVLTVDVPGCREAVDERVNGCLVPPGDHDALVAALESFIIHRDLLPAEARAARVKAVQSFDRHTVLAPAIAAIEG